MIVITGGGTGGHLSIAKSLCEAFNEEEVRPFYIGSTHGQDKTWFEGYPGFKKTIFLPTTGVVNQKGFKKMLALKNIFQQAFTCKTFFKEQNIKAVISVGGYGAAPGAFGALMCGIDLYIHEQNAINGKLNGLLKPFAKSFFSSYDENSPIKDYPVSKLFFEAYRPKKELKTLLFLGGSQGARAINDLALELAPWLNEHKIRIIHQCGDKDFQRVKSFYEKHNLDAQLFSFSKSLHEIFYEADAAIARSGAGSVWELCAAGVPALFIPYPYAAKDHQYYNAKALVDKGLATLMRQDEIEIKKVQEWILNLDVTSLSNKLHKQIEPGGAKSIAKEVLRGCQ
jgi:UDP-N-acetylglucosamine--N-acetylmuramyl-(pentapeptide) pyrophosphoryl-undecaprenol N-acetylglucosamine transferase